MIEQNELEPVSTTVGQQYKRLGNKNSCVSKLHNNFVLTILLIGKRQCVVGYAPTFVKDYIRAYAKILELDGEKQAEQLTLPTPTMHSTTRQ